MSAIQEQYELRCAYVAAHVYYLGQSMDLTASEINKVIGVSLMVLDLGKSGATAYELGAKFIRKIAANKPVAVMNLQIPQWRNSFKGMRRQSVVSDLDNAILF